MEDKNNIKLVVIGDRGTGKTCIIQRLLGKDFDGKSPATISPWYYSKSLILEGHSFTAEIWDTCGAEAYKSYTKIFLQGAKGAFIVYGINSKCSFDNIDSWIKLLKEAIKDNIPIIIIGTQCDLEDYREITVEEGELKAKEYGADFIETSALSGENILKAFEILMRRVTKIGTEDYYKSVYDKLKRDYDKLKADNDNNILKKNYDKLKEDNDILKKDYDKLKKDYDILKKDYDKLKKDNDNLTNELNKVKLTNFNNEDKLKKNLNEINNLKYNIRQKDDEIFKLNLKIRNIETLDKTSFKNDDIIYIHFISSDQNINCPIKCLKTDTFAEVEEKLYQRYQEYRETNNKFVLKEKTIMRFKKIIENNITDGDEIELIKIE